MKVALCLSGFARNFRRTFPSLERHLLRLHNPDVFFCTWDRTSPEAPPFDVNELLSLYKPVSWKVEPFGGVKFPAEAKPSDPFWMKSIQPMWHQIQSSLDLRGEHERELGIRYDVVIRARFDIVWREDVKLDDVQRGKICVGQYGVLRCNDMLAYGPSKAMDVYAACNDVLRRFVSRKRRVPVTKPELFLKAHLEKRGARIGYSGAPFYLDRYPRPLSAIERRYFRLPQDFDGMTPK